MDSADTRSSSLREGVVRAIASHPEPEAALRAALAALAPAGGACPLLLGPGPEPRDLLTRAPTAAPLAAVLASWTEGPNPAPVNAGGATLIPLRGAERLVAALVLGGDDAERHVATLGPVFPLLAAAADRVLGARRLARAEAEIAALRAIDAAVDDDRDAVQVYGVIAREAGLLLRADTALALVDRDGAVQAEAAHGERAIGELETDDARGDEVRRLVTEGRPAQRTVPAPGGPLRVQVAPLRSRERALGALVAVQPDGVHEPGDAAALARLADKAGLAVARLRDRQSEAKRLGQLALVSAAAEIAASTLDLPTLVGAIARYIHTSFGYYTVTIYLVEPELRDAVMAGAAGAAAQVMPRNHRVPFGRGIIGWVAQHGEHVLAADVRREPRFVASEMAATLSELAVPVKLAGEVVAVINVESDQIGDFDGSDLFAVDAIGAQVASAIRNARLFDEKVRALRTLEIVQEITNDLNSHLDLDELLSRIARRSVEAVRPAHRGAVLLYDGEALVARSSHGYPRPDALARVRLAFHEGLPGAVFVSGQGRAVRSTATDYGRESAYFREACADVAGCFALCVPIALPEEKLGVLLLESTTATDGFDAAGLRLAGTLAHQAAIAIGNALRMSRVLEMDRQRQDYLSNVSHELRTPLTVIQGYVEALANGTAGDRTPHYLEVALEQCQRLARRIDEVLELSRLEQGVARRHVQWKPVELRRVTTRVLQTLRGEAAVRQVGLRTELAEVTPFEGDERLLQMLVRSLVDNALKFTPPGGRVEVTLLTEADEAVLTVADTGIGIGAEHLDRIFDKFYMVDAGTRRAYAGAGIGLYLAREIVQIHAGRLDVASGPGPGSRFTARLPLRPRR